MTDSYLKAKLEEYLDELAEYYQSLENKKSKYPNLKDHIAKVMSKIDLQASYLEDELAEIETKEFDSVRLKYKTTVIMNSYAKMLEQIHRVLQFEPMMEVNQATKTGNNKKVRKQDQIKEFANQLNSEWMLQLLNKQKENKVKQPKTTAKASTQQQAINDHKKSIAVEQLKLQTQQLCQTLERIKMNVTSHKHQNMSQQIQALREQQKELLFAVEDIKQSNLLLKTEFEKLQKQLQHLRRNKQIMRDDH